jgi:hypothetical protein
MDLTRSQLAQALSATVRQVEEESGLGEDNPDVVELKRIVTRKIADLELPKTSDEQEPPDTTSASEVLKSQ